MATPKKKKGLPNQPAKEVRKAAEALGAEVLDPGEPQQPDLSAVSSGISKKTTEDEQKRIDGALDDLNEEIDANWRVAYDNASEWIEEAKEDVKFKAGEQWSAEDKQKLDKEGRPCLTFNNIKPIIKLLTGHFIQNSARIQVSPEGGEDQQFSDVADKVMDYIDKQANLEFNLGYQFEGGETTGRTFLELYLDYEKDPIFGELKSIYHGQPGIIFADPRVKSYDLNDGQFIFKLVRKTKSELRSMYPEKASEIDELSSDTEDPLGGGTGKEGGPNNYGIDPNRSKRGITKNASPEMERSSLRQYHVKEYWRFKYVDRAFVYYLDSGDLIKYKTMEEATAAEAERKSAFLAKYGPEAEGQWKTIIRKRQCKEAYVAIRCGGVVLADGVSPMEPHYSGFPFFQYIADWTPEAETDKLAMQGMVRCLKDPQREKNKARSQFLHIINTAANSGWIIDEDSMPKNDQADLKKFGSTPGIVIRKKAGSTVERIDPTPAPLAQQVREKAAMNDFKEVSGVNADLLAMDSTGNPSGKAIALRIRQAITILEPDFRNFRLTKKLIGVAIMKIVPTLFDVAKLKKVLGVNFLKTNSIDDSFLKAFMIQIEDLKYNVAIAEQGDTKTLREETLEDLMNLSQNGMQIPFDVIVEFMNIPNKTEMIGKIKAFQEQQQQAANALAAAKGGKGAPGAPAA